MKACYDEEVLRLFYLCSDDNPESNFTRCNDPLYNQGTHSHLNSSLLMPQVAFTLYLMMHDA